MIAEDNFVSISEVRDNTSQFFKTLPKSRKRFVMSHNKPVGVVMSLEEYNTLNPENYETAEEKKAYLNSLDDTDEVEAFSFLETLL